VAKNGITDADKVERGFFDLDWPGSEEYFGNDSHNTLIRSLLMHGGGGDGVKIPVGKVFGIRKNNDGTYSTGLVAVGLENLNRNPQSD